MATFYSSLNNGILAVISEEHAKLYGLIRKAEGKPTLAGCKIFTFCSQDRIDRDSLQKMVMTGTLQDLDVLVQAGGHQIVRQGNNGWDGYVPFSNGIESGAHGDDAKERELLYVTTLGDILVAFGNNAIAVKN